MDSATHTYQCPRFRILAKGGPALPYQNETRATLTQYVIEDERESLFRLGNKLGTIREKDVTAIQNAPGGPSSNENNFDNDMYRSDTGIARDKRRESTQRGV